MKGAVPSRPVAIVSGRCSPTCTCRGRSRCTASSSAGDRLYDWDFTILRAYWPALLAGLRVTVKLSALSIGVCTVLGFAIGLLTRVRIYPIRLALLAGVDVVRSIPPLVLMVVTNYFLPSLLDRPRMSAFAIASVVLTLNLASFIADVVRAAFAHVSAGEIAAARAVGLGEWQVFWSFVFPRVLHLTMPTLTLLYIATIKNSSLGSVIAVYELASVSNLISTAKYRTLEAFVAMTVLYILLIRPLTLAARRIDAAQMPRLT